MRQIFLILFTLFCAIPMTLSAQGRSLPSPPQDATATARGFHDSYTRCQHALAAAKALLPLPTANQQAFYDLLQLHHEAHSSSCTATVGVTFHFRSPTGLPHASPPRDSDWVQMTLDP